MASGTLTKDNIVIQWNSTSNKYSCTSTLECSLYIKADNTGYYGGYQYGNGTKISVKYGAGSNYVYTTKTFEVPAYSNTAGSTKYIGSFTISGIPHNNLTGEFTSSVYIETYGTLYYFASAGGTGKSVDISTATFYYASQLPLDVISRTTVTTVPSSAYIGDYVSVTVARLNNAFTHSIRYEFGNKTGYLLEDSTITNYSWLVPVSFEDEIPDNQNNKVCTLTTYTYYFDGIQTQTIGTETTKITLMIDPNLSGPVLEPTIEDVNNVTLALTGDKNIIVKSASIAKCEMNPTLLTTNDSIVNSYISNGSKKTDGTSATFYFPASDTFEFYAETRRGLTAKKNVKPNFVDYVSPTCRQKITTTISGDEATNATVTLLITGNYYNGSFGAQTNSLKLEVKHTQNDGTMGEWTDLTPLIPTIEGNTYSLEVTITGLRHDLAYTFTSRATDKLHSTESEEYVAKVLPVFDWSAEDFNFNIPINMNGQTVLRHNETANNLVLSASGGFIYLRPKGTNDNSIEVKITPQGNIELKGDIIINGVSLKSKLGIT